MTHEMFALYDDVTRQDFEQAAHRLGLVRHPSPQAAVPGLHEQVWASPDQTKAINYLEDPTLGLTYIVIRGDTDGQLTLAMSRLVQFFSPEEAIEFAHEASTTQQQVDAIYRLAAMFPVYDPVVMEIYGAFALKKGDALLREATVNAMGYRRWPEFRDLLEQLIASERNAKVMATARSILALVP